MSTGIHSVENDAKRVAVKETSNIRTYLRLCAPACRFATRDVFERRQVRGVRYESRQVRPSSRTTSVRYDQHQVRPASTTRKRQTRAIPAIRRHVGGPAERQPHLTNVFARSQRLLGGVARELVKHEVARHHTAIRHTEFIGNCLPKLTQSHETAGSVSVLPSRRSRPRTRQAQCRESCRYPQ